MPLQPIKATYNTKPTIIQKCAPTEALEPTASLIQLVEQLQELWMHVVNRLEEGQHSRVIGDAPATHVVALHAVHKSGDGVLQRLQELLVILLRLAILVLLLEESEIIQSRTNTAIELSSMFHCNGIVFKIQGTV